MDIINQLWCNGKEKDWKEILESYKYGIKEGHHQIEKEMQNLKFQDIKFLSTREFQNWLCNKFVLNEKLNAQKRLLLNLQNCI